MKIVRKKKKAKPVRNETLLNETDRAKRELKKKKRRKRIKRRLTIFLFLLVCVGTIFAVLKAPVFNIKTVYCVGQQKMTEAEILEIAQVETGKNIFSTNIKTVDKRLAANPEIAEFNVRRIFPNKIKIWVKEAVAVAFTEHEEQLLFVDINGKIIRTLSAEESGEAPKITQIDGVEVFSTMPGEQIFAQEDVRAKEFFRCADILSNLKMLDKVNYISFADLSDIKIDYENRLYMLLGSYENLEYKLKFSKKVIEENISEYEKALFDFRSDKLYVGPREDPEKVDQPMEEQKTDEESTDNDDAPETEQSTETEKTEESAEKSGEE